MSRKIAAPGIILHSRFRFQFLLRKYSRMIPDSVVPQLFIRAVGHQCRLGFRNVDVPIAIFHELDSLRPRPSIIVFTQLFTAMTKIRPNPPFSAVVTLCHQLEVSGVRPDMHSVCVLAKCYSGLGRVDFAFSVMGKGFKLGYPPDIVIVNTILKGYSESGKVDKAMDIFRGMQHMTVDVVTYNTLIDAMCKKNRLRDAFQIFEDMQDRGVAPNVVTYSSLLDGLFRNGEINKAMSLRREMEEKKVASTRTTYGIILDGLCEARRLAEAQEVFSFLLAKGLRPNVHMYTIMIKGLCIQGLLSDATELFKEMVDNGCSPDDITYNIIIKGFLNVNNVGKALEYLQSMTSQGFSPNADNKSLFLFLLLSSKLSDTDNALLQKYFHDHDVKGKRIKEASCDCNSRNYVIAKQTRGSE